MTETREEYENRRKLVSSRRLRLESAQGNVPDEPALPDWEDLRGRAPAATGALTSEDFVRELRDAWR